MPASIFIIDVGNTRIKWAFARDRGLFGLDGVAHIGKDIPRLLDQSWGQLNKPKGVLLASVAGQQVTGAIVEWVEKYWAISSKVVHSLAAGYGVTSGYADPNQLGVDRWLTLIAAWHDYRVALTIVDAGTAITIDTIDNSGQHLGGLILPGIKLMQASMLQRTHIPENKPGEELHTWECDTGSAVRSASMLAAASLVDRVVGEWESSHHEKMLVLLTGNDATQLAELITHDTEVVDGLVMHGLQLIAATEG